MPEISCFSESDDRVRVRPAIDDLAPRLREHRRHVHDLRHFHVAHLIAAGEQPLLIAKQLGHASAAFTLDRYGHLFDEAGAKAASAVALMVDGEP
jgi:integrase